MIPPPDPPAKAWRRKATAPPLVRQNCLQQVPWVLPKGAGALDGQVLPRLVVGNAKRQGAPHSASTTAGKPSSGGAFSYLKAFDAFPKQRDEAAEFFHRTMSGGIITLVSALIMTLLFFSELSECQGAQAL